MDFLQKRGAIVAASRRPVLTNRLIMVAPLASRYRIEALSAARVLEILGQSRLAVGDPAHVPAGLYAKAALRSLGLWTELRPRLAPMATVRAALVMVERGETPLGIVYLTDARASRRVRAVYHFPEASHPQIRYSAALVAGRATKAARAFLEFLGAPAARTIFARRGFGVP